MTRRLGRNGRVPALPMLAAILIASGVLRLGSGTGEALAREVGDLRLGATNATCEPAEDVSAVLAALDMREERLVAQEKQLADRQAALADAERDIAEQLSRLEVAEADLEALLTLSDTAAEDDLARLTSVYENMKPKEAAALFEEMAPKFAAGFLGRMRPEAAARIMAGLKPESAYGISVMLAGRNADLPQQ